MATPLVLVVTVELVFVVVVVVVAALPSTAQTPALAALAALDLRELYLGDFRGFDEQTIGIYQRSTATC